MHKKKTIWIVILTLLAVTAVFFISFEVAKRKEHNKAQSEYKDFIYDINSIGGVRIGQDNKSVLYGSEPTVAKNELTGEYCLIEKKMLVDGIDRACSIWIYHEKNYDRGSYRAYAGRKNENEAVEIRTVTFDSDGRVKEINCKLGKSLFSHCEIVSGIHISSKYMFRVADLLGYLYDWEYVDYNGSAGKKVSYERLGLELTFVGDVLVEANKTQANPRFEEWYADYKPSFTLWHYVKTIFDSRHKN